MKMPKNWNKLNLSEQESWLVKKYQEMNQQLLTHFLIHLERQ